MKQWLGVFLLLAGCAGGGGLSRLLSEEERPATTDLARAVDLALASPSAGDSLPVGEADALLELYHRETDRLLWFRNTTPRPALDSLLAILGDAAAFGLDAPDFHHTELRRQREALDSSKSDSALVALDVLASQSAVRFLAAIATGQVAPRAQGFRIAPPRRGIDFVALIDSARRDHGMRGAVRLAEPDDPEYRRLQSALSRYREIAREGELPALPTLRPNVRITPGDSAWLGLAALRVRLQAFGDLAAGHSPVDRYDSTTAAAVRRFQTRHGIDADGIIGATTIGAMNVSAESRAQQLALALERRRWFPVMGGGRAVVVNLPFYELAAFTHPDSAPSFEMRVVIGQRGDHATPVFADSISYLVFRPYWHIPTSLAARELVDSALADTTYLSSHDFEIVQSHLDSATARTPSAARLDSVRRGSLYLRQRPGPLNSLGRVKFLFPNSDDIYLHDSPARVLFRRDRRALSHGCVRVDDPARLAAWLLGDQAAWTAAKIREAMDGAAPVTVRLTRKVPVVLWYATATVDVDGTVRFAEDPYGLDLRLRRALGVASPP